MIRALSVVLLTAVGCASPVASGDGWIDLLPDASLKGWRRVPIKPLADKAVWSVSPAGHLVVDGVEATEMLLCERALGDGVLRVEWRYRRNDDPKHVYNGGVYVRTALDGKTWVQAQVAHGEKPPVCGDLIAMLPGSTQRTDMLQQGASPARAPGEWNTYEIACRGRTIALSVNGKPTVAWNDCPLRTGAVGLQAEFAVYEVRAFRFRPD